MSRSTYFFRASLLIAVFTSPAYAANPLPPEQAKELGNLHQTYSAESQAAIAVRKQAENLQTEIATQQAKVTELQGKADKAETDLSELQEFDRKKPGNVNPEKMDAARSKHLQARTDVEAAQKQLAQQQSKLTQLKEDLAKKNLATEHNVSNYQTLFEALAKEAVTRSVNALKVPKTITESASLACDDLPLKECKVKTQQEVQRRAIEKGAIVVVDSVTEIKNLQLQKDEIKSEVHGEISNLKILDTKLSDEPATYAMKIQATVTPVIGNSLLAEINRTVRADMSLQVGDGGLASQTNSTSNQLVDAPDPSTFDPTTAVEYSVSQLNNLLKKAKEGNVQAQYEIAVMYNNGQAGKKDEAQALAWAQKSASHNYPPAQSFMARKYDGQSRDASIDHNAIESGGNLFFKPNSKSIALANKAKKLAKSALPALRKLAESGDSNAQVELGVLYLWGLGVVEDSAAASNWFQLSAKQGNAEAKYFLAGLLKDGDIELSVALYKQAASEGVSDAKFELGLMYLSRDKIPKNEIEGYQWLEEVALQGNEAAKSIMSARANNDEKFAVEWYEKLAASGDVDAHFKLGGIYLNGKGVAQDDAKAFEWFKKAAWKGDAGAQFVMCGAYAHGKSVEKNEVKAFEWCKKAALQGKDFAQYELGRRYFVGSGVAMNKAKAFEWFEKAAMQGDAKAQGFLGAMYLEGQGVRKDPILAYAWVNLCASQGGDDSKLAEETRATIELTASEMTEAERLSSEWKIGTKLHRKKK